MFFGYTSGAIISQGHRILILNRRSLTIRDLEIRNEPLIPFFDILRLILKLASKWCQRLTKPKGIDLLLVFYTVHVPKSSSTTKFINFSSTIHTFFRIELNQSSKYRTIYVCAGKIISWLTSITTQNGFTVKITTKTCFSLFVCVHPQKRARVVDLLLFLFFMFSVAFTTCLPSC